MTTTTTPQINGKVYLITGSNVGLGFDAARQLALRNETKTVYLACRSEAKATAAINKLIQDHGIPDNKLVFAPFDASASKDVISEKMITTLPSDEKIDGVILNAGGFGKDTSGLPVGPNNVLDMFQINLVGHIHLLEALQSQNFLKEGETVIVFSGSEAARGLPGFGIGTPKIPDTVDKCKTLLDGTAFKTFTTFEVYAHVKAVAALYWASWARKNPNFHILCVSPGATRDTAIGGQADKPPPKVMIFIFDTMLGLIHALDVGAKRYIDAIDREGDFKNFKSGSFIASARGATGRLINQVDHKRGAIFSDENMQDVAYQAVQAFV